MIGSKSRPCLTSGIRAALSLLQKTSQKRIAVMSKGLDFTKQLKLLRQREKSHDAFGYRFGGGDWGFDVYGDRGGRQGPRWKQGQQREQGREPRLLEEFALASPPPLPLPSSGLP